MLSALFNKKNIQTTWVPLMLSAIVLVILNLGLYTRLSAIPLPTIATELPYFAAFDENILSTLLPFAGDWEQRDETLVQMSLTGDDLGVVLPLEVAPEVNYLYQTKLRFLGGSMGGGLVFNLQQPTSRQQSHMVRFNVDAGQLYVIYGYFGDDSNFTGQGSFPLTIPVNDDQWHSLAVEVTGETYAVLVDGQRVAENIGAQYQGGSVGVITSTSQFAFDDLSVTALGDGVSVVAVPEATVGVTAEPVTDVQVDVQPQTETVIVEAVDTPLIEDDFAIGAGGASLWMPFSGQWVFEDDKLIQKDATGYDFSAGYRQELAGNYLLRATFIHLEGQGGGVLFNLPRFDSKNGGHMVRYVDDADFLSWGYFDETGQFTGQGSAPVPAPGTTTHIVEIAVTDTTYSISVDGELIALDIPLMSTSGHIGLTAARSVVAFENVEVLPLTATTTQVVVVEPEATAEPVMTNDGLTLNTITGDWQTENGQTIQIDEAPVDFIAGTGVAAETFQVNVNITLPDTLDDAGGGLVFHMQGRDNPASGQMVRFGGGGSEIFWGAYDEQGVFQGQGSSPLTLDWEESHSLSLVVTDETFDILVDDVLIIGGVPLQGDAGWIGLVSFRGPVSFSDFELTLGEA